MRIVIGGGPRCGKTTAAIRLGQELGITNVRHTDSLLNLGHSWSEISELVADWFNQLPPPWIIEGTRTSYALRKWQERHPGQAPPLDHMIFLTMPAKPWTTGQAHMAQSITTVHRSIDTWLSACSSTPLRPPSNAASSSASG